MMYSAKATARSSGLPFIPVPPFSSLYKPMRDRGDLCAAEKDGVFPILGDCTLLGNTGYFIIKLE